MSIWSLDGSQTALSINTESLSQDDAALQSRQYPPSTIPNHETRPTNKYGVMKPHQVTMMSASLIQVHRQQLAKLYSYWRSHSYWFDAPSSKQSDNRVRVRPIGKSCTLQRKKKGNINNILVPESVSSCALNCARALLTG